MSQQDMFDRERNTVMAAKDYAEFRRLLAASNCRRCELHKGRENIVVDRGNHKAKIMVVGEAPGDNEDKQGAAFVGRSGKLLDQIMESIALDSNRDMLICNIAKCRPPDNRAPKREEVSVCLPYLERQVELQAPRVMLLMGATAYKSLLQARGSFSMEENVGKFFETPRFPGIRLMVLYHPAYLLRNPPKKKDMWKHVRGLRKWLVAEGIVGE